MWASTTPSGPEPNTRPASLTPSVDRNETAFDPARSDAPDEAVGAGAGGDGDALVEAVVAPRCIGGALGLDLPLEEQPLHSIVAMTATTTMP